MFFTKIPSEQLHEQLERAVSKVMKGVLVSEDLVLGQKAEIEKLGRVADIDAGCVASMVQAGELPMVEVDGLKFCSVESLAAFCFRVYDAANSTAEFGGCCSKFDQDSGAAPTCSAFVPACALSQCCDTGGTWGHPE